MSNNPNHKLDSNDFEELKTTIRDIVKNKFDQEIEVIILRFEDKQDAKNEKKFASKRFEDIMNKIINGTTWALFAGIGLLVVQAIVSFIKSNAGL